MSLKVLFAEIERLRAELHSMAADQEDYEKILEISQVLDELIVKYLKAAV